MSALGECVQSGETGTVTRVQHMPDQIPDNPGTIAATTSIETIQEVMYRNWIWRNQFTVDVTMLPGHVFGTIKIHPQNCHDYLSYISRMFLTWTGSMKIRSRFQATFQFGGSFRLGWLPPKFTQQQVQNLPIQTLTAYPNIDLDPKNTCWMEFQASEERNILFHWMESLETETPESFGGWFVFYVAAPLVISGGAGSSVTMLVESAGSFNFAQLAPITSVAPSINGIIDQDSLFTQVGCDDYARIEAIQIFSKATKSLPLGWFHARATQDRWTRDMPNVTMSDPIRTWVTAVNYTPDTAANYELLPSSAFDWLNIDLRAFKPSILNQQLNGNTENVSYSLMTPYSPKSGGNITGFENKFVYGNNLYFTFKWQEGQQLHPQDGYGIGSSSYRVTTWLPETSAIRFATDTKGYPQPDTSTMPIALSESILGFVSFRHRSMSIQTSGHGNKIAASKMDNNTSQLYQLYADDNPTPLLTIRLTPFGYFTTNAVDADALLTGKNLYLRYLQDLPMSTPIPSLTYEQTKFMRRAIQCTKHGVAPNDMEDKLWSRF